jgi:hypothetical protein
MVARPYSISKINDNGKNQSSISKINGNVKNQITNSINIDIDF